MPRLHLFEIEDQEWFPSFLRDYMTDFLQHVCNTFDLYKGAVPFLKKALLQGGDGKVVDLASGGGGSWLKLSEHLEEEVPDLKVKFTDYFPNEDAFKRTVQQNEAVFEYETASINALDVPHTMKGLRTMFLSFHHFRPEQAQQILQDAVDDKQPIAIFEAMERNVMHFIQFMFSPINVLLLTPFIRPFKLGRLLFTYLIPIVPLFVWWDGIVSVLRTYSVAEMQTMASKVNNSESFTWEIGKTRNKGVTVQYLIGYPKN